MKKKLAGGDIPTDVLRNQATGKGTTCKVKLTGCVKNFCPEIPFGVVE